MMNVIAVNEQPSTLKLITYYCARIDFINLQKTFTDPQEAMRYVKKYPVDLMILDSGLSDVSLIHFISSLPEEMMIVCLLNSRLNALEGLIRHAVYYLIKPFLFDNFHQALKKFDDYHAVTHQNGESRKKYIYVRADYGLKKIAIEDILYIEALDDYTKIHLTDSRLVVVKMTMKKILEKLEHDDFVRVHRSFIVPLNRISTIRKKTIYLSGVEIPIGQSYRQNFERNLGK